MPTADVVTGAFSYTGSFIARRLIAAGHQVRTLTNNPSPPPDLREKVASAPLDFEDADNLVRFMRGADTLYNTYWIHSNYGADAFGAAVHRSKKLFAAARESGIRRIVHLSIANPSASRHPYYASKFSRVRHPRRRQLPPPARARRGRGIDCRHRRPGRRQHRH